MRGQRNKRKLWRNGGRGARKKLLTACLLLATMAGVWLPGKALAAFKCPEKVEDLRAMGEEIQPGLALPADFFPADFFSENPLQEDGWSFERGYLSKDGSRLRLLRSRYQSQQGGEVIDEKSVLAIEKGATSFREAKEAFYRKRAERRYRVGTVVADGRLINSYEFNPVYLSERENIRLIYDVASNYKSDYKHKHITEHDLISHMSEEGGLAYAFTPSPGEEVVVLAVSPYYRETHGWESGYCVWRQGTLTAEYAFVQLYRPLWSAEDPRCQPEILARLPAGDPRVYHPSPPLYRLGAPAAVPFADGSLLLLLQEGRVREIGYDLPFSINDPTLPKQTVMARISPEGEAPQLRRHPSLAIVPMRLIRDFLKHKGLAQWEKLPPALQLRGVTADSGLPEAWLYEKGELWTARQEEIVDAEVYRWIVRQKCAAMGGRHEP